MLKSVFIVGPKAIQEYNEFPAAPALEEFKDWSVTRAKTRLHAFGIICLGVCVSAVAVSLVERGRNIPPPFTLIRRGKQSPSLASESLLLFFLFIPR
jgi:hypothetical protein